MAAILILMSVYVKSGIKANIVGKGSAIKNATNKVFAKRVHASVTKATLENFVTKKMMP